MQRHEMNISRQNDTAAFQRIGVKDWDGKVNALKVRKGGIGGFRDEMSFLQDCHDFPETQRLIDDSLDCGPIQSTSRRHEFVSDTV
jgi:hypothetical protein